MNLVIGFVILLCLFCSEFRGAEVAKDWWPRMLMVGIVTMTVPGLALFQTLIVSRRLRGVDLGDNQSSAVLTRISVCHSAVWLIASLAIVWAVRWQDVVRGTWELDRWPLIDEVMILAPVILSLVASWAIFFEVQQSIDGTGGHPLGLENIKRRIEYVSIRFRIYFLLALIPVTLVVLSRDLAPWMRQLNSAQTTIAYLISALAFMAGFPLLLLFIWRTRRIDDHELKSELMKTCIRHRLHVHDIRIWNTGNQIVNALVAGILPQLRVILLSDSLVKWFPKNELLAIVRHEAGHLRLWHLPIRIAFIVLPLIALAMDEKNSWGVINRLDSLSVDLGLPAGSGVATIVIVYLVYLFFCLPWLSHRMEFEADIYACHACSLNGKKSAIHPDLASDMSDALLRLASVVPSQYERRTLMHPSLGERIALIRDIRESPVKAERFLISIARRRRIALAILSAFCLLTTLV